MSEAVVALDSIRVQYGAGSTGVRALDSVSLHVRAGEVLMIVGPSGSGKTTLLQVLGLLLRPTSGAVQVNGRKVDGLPLNALRQLRLECFGFVFQAHHLIPSLKAWENVALALDLKGIRGRTAEERSRELLDVFGLSGRAEAYPNQLSGGQRQRVAIARACALDAPVILADEPTASLDTSSGWQVTQVLRQLADREGRAVVFVTHDNRLTVVANRIVTIEDGRIVSDNAANVH
jgi:putative ABC transport system ATP-binding protein